MRSVLTTLLLLLTASCAAADDTAAAHAVLERLLGARAAQFHFEHLDGGEGNDAYEVSAKGGTVTVRGTSAVALTRGAYDYLRESCRCMVSWSGRNLELPARWPDAAPRRVRTPFALRQYFNVCTFGYTTVWWDWARWEREIDWMALHGIDMPLAMVGQEAVWEDVWQSFGVAPEELAGYFTGPAFLPWHRMGNLNAHDGPLDRAWIGAQAVLQQRILARMRELGMHPVAPAFSGFVPPAFAQRHPQARVLGSSAWGGFGPEYRTAVLAPDSPLFVEIGRRFIQAYEARYGAFDYYLADTFNELTPPVRPDRRDEDLAAFGRTVHASIEAGHPGATWVMQGWMFESDRQFWTPEAVRALLRDVPDERMLVLDLSNERFHGWKAHAAFSGKPWIYSIIHNFGGNNPLNGDLGFVASDPYAMLADPAHGRLAGYGLAPEGIENNEVMYELLTDVPWREGPIDLARWLPGYLRARYGSDNARAQHAWEALRATAYARMNMNVKHALQMRPGQEPRSDIEASPRYRAILEDLYAAAPALGARPLYRNDLVEVAAQYLAVRIDARLAAACAAQRAGDAAARDAEADAALRGMRRLDELLETRPDLRLQSWIEAARRAAPDPAQADAFERDARLQVSLWGSTELFDYAAKLWSGLVRDFYAARWERYFALLRAGQSPEAARAQVAQWETSWAGGTGLSAPAPRRDLFVQVRELLAQAP